MLKRITLAIGLLLAPTAALAQSSVLPYYYNAGGTKVPVGSSNPLPISGSFSASLAPFTPGLSGARATPITVTVADSSGNLPTNTGSVIVYNVGANPMYCNVNGIAATVADQYISSAGGWFNFGVPAGTTTLHCIATGGSTTANAAGGTGLGAGTGGGSGGAGGGGAITAASGSYASGALSAGSIASGAYASGSIGSGAVASGAYASGSIGSGAMASGAVAAGAVATGAIVDGAYLTDGAIADAAVTAGATGSNSAKLRAISRDIGTVATNSALPLPAQTGIGNVNIGAVQSAGSKYIAVAASQTATVLQASAGAAGDYLSHCVIYPTSTSPGVVTVFDNTNTAATSAILFAGGATSTSNLTPISVPVGAVSTAGAWKVTTGASVSVVCYGKFS